MSSCSSRVLKFQITHMKHQAHDTCIVDDSVAFSKEHKTAYEVIDQGFQDTARTIHAHTRSLAIFMGSESLALLGRKGSWKSRCSKVELNLQRIISWAEAGVDPDGLRMVSAGCVSRH